MNRFMVMAAVAVMLAALFPSPCACAQMAASWCSSSDGRELTFIVTRPQLDETPSWPDEAENPPLSARKAIAIARSYLPKLVSDAERWSLGRVSLKPMGKDKWVYVVQMNEPDLPRPMLGKTVHTMQLVVLMNGETVKPVISKSKRSDE